MRIRFACLLELRRRRPLSQSDELATKPKDTRVGYVGFRCVATL